MISEPVHHPVATVPAESLRRRAIHGTLVISAAQAVKLIVQFLSVIVLARLLTPTDFGHFAMIMPIAAFVMMLQDLGLSQAAQTSKELDDGQASALFWINTALSAALALLFAASAPLMAAFYKEPQLQTPIFALAATVLASGLAVQHFALLTRSMRFAALAWIDIASALCGFAVAVVIGLWAPSIWALVWSVIVSMAIGLIGAWMVSGWRPGRPASYARIRDMLRLGGGLSTFSLSNFLARNLDNILIGRFAGPLQLGLYDRAYKLLLFPLQQINNPIGRVMVPVLARLRDEPERYREAYRRVLQALLAITIPGVVFLLVHADDIILSLMGSRWTGAIGIFTWLAIAALHQPMTATLGWLFVSQQRGRDFAHWGIFNAATSIAAFVIGLPWGAIGVAAAYALSDVAIRLPALWWWVSRRGPVGLHDLARIALPFAAAMPVSVLLLFGIHREMAADTPMLRMLLGGAAAYASFWAVIALFGDGRSIFRELLDIARRRLSPVLGPAAA